VDLSHHTQLLSECSLHDLCLAHSLLCSPYLQGPRHLIVDMNRLLGLARDVALAPCPVCHLHATLPRSALVMRSCAFSVRPLASNRPVVQSYQTLALLKPDRIRRALLLLMRSPSSSAQLMLPVL